VRRKSLKREQMSFKGGGGIEFGNRDREKASEAGRSVLVVGAANGATTRNGAYKC